MLTHAALPVGHNPAVYSPAVVIIGQVKLGIVLAPEVCATILWQGRPVR
jgi:hypothetical protein